MWSLVIIAFTVTGCLEIHGKMIFVLMWRTALNCDFARFGLQARLEDTSARRHECLPSPGSAPRCAAGVNHDLPDVW